ncbi:conserved hypothetical protein [Coccidioides posadasii str. Silveira]|uniref:Uncharacterized protein n=1 Tax=Coccidioides posadasii (strain RMSCC 757 / Silveira) TaxID=443226 RepID=E9D5Y4_COCPS|nr:conserved hypothetical protein [Coccidioides posadasii str. Silveira]
MHETSHIDAEMWDKQAQQWPLAGIGMFQHIARSSAFSDTSRALHNPYSRKSMAYPLLCGRLSIQVQKTGKSSKYRHPFETAKFPSRLLDKAHNSGRGICQRALNPLAGRGYSGIKVVQISRYFAIECETAKFAVSQRPELTLASIQIQLLGNMYVMLVGRSDNPVRRTFAASQGSTPALAQWRTRTPPET